MKQSKINDSGKFQPYFGCTVVCFVEEDLTKAYEALRKCLPKNAYSMVPYDSLHMTMNGLWTLNSLGCDLELHEREVCKLVTLKGSLEKWTPSTFALSPCGNYTTGVHVKPATYEESMEIEGIRKTISRDSKRISVQGKYHITFAYKFSQHSLSEGERKAVGEAYSLLPTEIRLSRPVVCEFSSMERYRKL